MDLSNVVWLKANRSSDNGGDCVELTVVTVSDGEVVNG